MRRLISAVLLALAAARPASAQPASAQPADPLAPFRRLAGEWAGTLTYTDYTDDATRVELGVRIGVAERRDSLGAPALELRYAYTEPDGRAVEGGRDLLVPGTDPARVSFGDHGWAVLARDTTGGRLRLVVEREGDDNDRPATIRETLTATGDAWTLLKEIRYSGTDRFFERHTYALRRTAPRIPGDALRADVALLRRAFETLHPGLLRYATPAEVGARFDALDAAVAGGLSLPDAYLAFARLLGTVRCGHTYPNFYNQSPAVTAAVVRAGRRLPAYARWIGGALVVTRDLTADGSLRRGSEIVAVDGVPSDTVLARLLPLARADGGVDAKRVATLAVTGAGQYEALDVYLPLVFGLGETAALDLRDPLTGARRSVRVPTMTADARDAVRDADARTRRGTPGVGWTVRALDAETALLTMPSWATYGDWDWQAFVDSTFDALVAAGTPRLVVDLRGNEGGNDDVGGAILSRLAARETPVAAFDRSVRSRTTPADLVPVLDTWNRSFDDWTAQTPAEPTSGLYRLAGGAPTVRPRGRRYAGRVAVIVGAANSSATFVFARALRQAGLGVLVGQTTGGNQRGLNASAFYFLRLPGSGIEVDLPLIAFVPPGGAASVPDAGLAPDVAVVPRAADVARGVDAELEAARRVALARPLTARPTGPRRGPSTPRRPRAGRSRPR